MVFVNLVMMLSMLLGRVTVLMMVLISNMLLLNKYNFQSNFTNIPGTLDTRPVASRRSALRSDPVRIPGLRPFPLKLKSSKRIYSLT